MWAAVKEARPDLWSKDAAVNAAEGCPPAALVALALRLVAHVRHGSITAEGLLQLEELLRYAFEGEASLAALVCSGFPVFGALDLLADAIAESSPGSMGSEEGCFGLREGQFQALLHHHLAQDTLWPGPMPLPAAAALDLLQATHRQSSCVAARAAATLALAAGQARPVGHGLCLGEASMALMAKAEDLMLALAESGSLALHLLSRRWLPARLLHELSRVFQAQLDTDTEEPSEECLVLIYTFPTEEIRADVKKALRSLQANYVDSLGSEPRLVVFVDAESEQLLDSDVRPFTSLRITPAVIPERELRRPMRSYSCQRGEVCTSGDTELELLMDAHRGKVNETQYWSPTYLRISRYTAGPLFLHPALDNCRYFLKIDTDFFFTQPLELDPIQYMKNSGLRLGYWQIHVQGQRQQGYMDAALAFLKARANRQPSLMAGDERVLLPCAGAAAAHPQHAFPCPGAVRGESEEAEHSFGVGSRCRPGIHSAVPGLEK